jgi:hypothetical protein
MRAQHLFTKGNMWRSMQYTAIHSSRQILHLHSNHTALVDTVVAASASPETDDLDIYHRTRALNSDKELLLAFAVVLRQGVRP